MTQCGLDRTGHGAQRQIIIFYFAEGGAERGVARIFFSCVSLCVFCNLCVCRRVGCNNIILVVQGSAE